ncbi:MAG: hypothetical protein AB7P04_01500 [Bacteriovoracia bacterium]
MQPRNKMLTAVLALAMGVAGCTSVPVKKIEITPEEQVRLDHEAGLQVAAKFEPQQKFKRNEKVSHFLADLGTKGLATIAVLNRAKVEVKILADEAKAWDNYGLPGVRLYLSAGVLKRTEYESEVAALIALQLAAIHKRVLMERLAQDPQASLRLSAAEVLVLIDGAVQILYDSGYDSRGLVSLWDIYAGSPKNSPYTEKQLQSFKEKTHRAIVRFAPLINPIVRTDRFIAVHDRIKQL